MGKMVIGKVAITEMSKKSGMNNDVLTSVVSTSIMDGK